MKCNWTENNTKVSYTPYDIPMPYYKIIECNSTNIKRDKDNVNERYFCEIHLKQVKETRKLMHKNCVNKEKIINSIKEQIQDELDKGDNGIPYIEALDLIKDLENGEFD